MSEPYRQDYDQMVRQKKAWPPWEQKSEMGRVLFYVERLSSDLAASISEASRLRRWSWAGWMVAVALGLWLGGIAISRVWKYAREGRIP